MHDDKDFQGKVQRIGKLVAGLDDITDTEARASAKNLVQLILDLHAAGLEQVMEIVATNGDPGQHIIDDLGCDPLVSSLLVLYGLHPLDLETRVAQAVKRVQQRVRKGGGELELLGMDGATVRLRLQVTGHACGSTGKTLKAMVEDALYEDAPDIETLLIEGLEEQSGSSGFVPIANLSGAIVSGSLLESRGLMERRASSPGITGGDARLSIDVIRTETT